MTCQWCKNYRRRNGQPKCWFPFDDGVSRLVDVKGADGCLKFTPRVCCTTCEHRCPPDYRSQNGRGGKCPKWALRALTTWGGSRRASSTNNNKET